MYSYEKQIERLLQFVQSIYLEGCIYAPYRTCEQRVMKVLAPSEYCPSCRAYKLLNDEPVRYTGKLMGTGEGYEQPVRSLENPTNRASTYYLGQCE